MSLKDPMGFVPEQLKYCGVVKMMESDNMYKLVWFSTEEEYKQLIKMDYADLLMQKPQPSTTTKQKERTMEKSRERKTPVFKDGQKH